MPSTLERVRAQARLAADERIPDTVLLLEAQQLLEPPDLWGPEEWFRARLTGEADTESGREALASHVREGLAERKERNVGRRPWGLAVDWNRNTHRSRRKGSDSPPKA
jgi:hypothetical protein